MPRPPGKRIGREQERTRAEREDLAELREEVDQLRAEVAAYRNRDMGEGTPLRPQ